MLIRPSFKETGLYLLGFLQLFSFSETSKVCYYQPPDNWTLSEEGRNLEDNYSGQCFYKEPADSFNYMLCPSPSEKHGQYLLKSCHCIMKHKKSCKRNFSCSGICNDSKVCANGGTPEQKICDQDTVVHEGNITCKCPPGGDFRGQHCGEIKVTGLRLCSVVDNEKVTVKDSRGCNKINVNGTTVCCQAPILDPEVIEKTKKAYQPCSAFRSNPSLSSDRLSGNTSTNAPKPQSGSSPFTKTTVLAVILVMAVVIIVLCGVIAVLFRKNQLLKRKEAYNRMLQTSSLSIGHSPGHEVELLMDRVQSQVQE